MAILMLQIVVLVLSCAVHSCWVKEYQELEAKAETSARRRSKRMARVQEEAMVNVSKIEEVKGMVNEIVNHFQTHYLQYCSPHVPEQRMAIGLATVVEWRCWSIFWLRTPKQYRESVITPEFRQMYVRSEAIL